MSTAYVGFTTTTHERWEEVSPEPQAPANYKDQEKIMAWIETARARQAVTACDRPLTGKIKDFFLVEKTGPTLADHRVVAKGGWPKKTALEILSGYKRIFVIRAGVLAVLARAEHIDRYGTVQPQHKWIFTTRMQHFPLLYEKPALAPKLYDPIDILVSSTAEENCDPGLVLRRYPAIGDTLQGRYDLKRAEDWCAVARMVAVLLGE